MTTALKALRMLAVVAAGLWSFAQALAQPIELIVPFPPGGSVDPPARVMQVSMQKSLGRPLVISNQPGAAGTLGTARVARAAPDGNVIGLTTVGPLTTQPHMMSLSYDVDSFDYVCRTHITPQVLVVLESSPFKTLKDLVDYAKAHPGKVSLSSTGVGSLPHLAEVEFGQIAGINWLHVPTKGDAEAARLALSGDITGWVAGVQTMAQLRERLRPLGILLDKRSPDYPDLPTFKEQGYPLTSIGWGGLIVPKGTPAATVAKLSAACATATHTPEFEQLLRTLHVPQGYLAADEFANFVHNEYERYDRLIKSIGANNQDVRK